MLSAGVVRRVKLVGELGNCCGSVVVSCCYKKLVTGAGSVREPRGRGKSAVGSRYQATASEGVTTDTRACVTVNSL
jgi:hypothetical protein